MGDLVLLAPGPYSTTSEGIITQPPDFAVIRISKQITLRGEGGPELTILDAEQQGRVIYLDNAGEVHLEGVTLSRGVGFGFIPGAGCFSDGNTRPTISNCIIKGCDGGDGGGIYCTNAVITNCIVRDCRGGERGGGIYCENSTVTECRLISNFAGSHENGNGGGINCLNSLISGCLFKDNWVIGDGDAVGGGISARETGSIVDCWIEGNRASAPFGASAGGIAAASAAVRNCVFVDNAAFALIGPSYGGALTAAGEVSGSIFVANRASSSYERAQGSAVYGYSTARMSRCTILGNSASGVGGPVGGVFAAAGATIKSTIIASNEGLPCGGAGTFACCDLFGNSLGDALCGMDGGGNFSADPQFCATDPVATRNFTLQEDSPCAPGRHPNGVECGIIGAKEIGCGSVLVVPRTWSEIKSMYR